MDQCSNDQNNETRDFLLANEGSDSDLVDMELEPRIEDKIHSSDA